jgi:NADPH-dependent glutamate synthase beta subunit-like oxidoreductase
VQCGKRVAVIGGGNAAVDAARSAVRLGAEKVTILYRRSREEMPAYEEEIEAALEEGVELVTLVAPKAVKGKRGRVDGVEMVRMRLGDADEKGRRKPVPVEGSDFLFPCDTVIPAVGQVPSVEAAEGKLAVSDGPGGLAIDILSGATNVAGVFAGGDVVSGGGTVIEAIAAGQKAAVAIDRMLGGAGLLPANQGPGLWRPTDEQLERVTARVREPALPAVARARGFEEVMGPLAVEAACGEASRCMRCDLERAAARAQTQAKAAEKAAAAAPAGKAR